MYLFDKKEKALGIRTYNQETSWLHHALAYPFLALMILVTVSIVATIVEITNVHDTVLNLVIAISFTGIMVFCYRVNKKGDGKSFFKRFAIAALRIEIKTTILSFLTMLPFAFLFVPNIYVDGMQGSEITEELLKDNLFNSAWLGITLLFTVYRVHLYNTFFLHASGQKDIP